jgi:hypothetical protein
MVADRSDHDLSVCARLRDQLWTLDDVPDIGSVMEPLRGLSVTTDESTTQGEMAHA